MVNTEHNALATSALHENKGVSTATDNTVATAVSGATVWAKLTASNLTTSGNPFGAQLFHVQEQKTSGTSDGTFTSGAWRTRTLSTSVTNEITSASLASNQITLPSGTYHIEARAQAYSVSSHTVKLRNITDGSDTLIGMSERSIAGVAGTSYVGGRFTISGSKVFELQHRCETTEASDGLGRAATFGVTEVYVDIKIWKVL